MIGYCRIGSTSERLTRYARTPPNRQKKAAYRFEASVTSLRFKAPVRSVAPKYAIECPILQKIAGPNIANGPGHVRPGIGCTGASDEYSGSKRSPILVLSHAFWKRRSEVCDD